MKTLSTLALVGLLFFACKLCSFSDNTNRSNSNSNSSPSPQKLMYARDFIKQYPGRPYTLVKTYDKEEARKTASGFTVKLIERSSDTAGGEYKMNSGGTVVLMACSYSDTATPAALVDELETSLRGASAWKSVRAIPKSTGKRVEGVDGQGNGLVVWSNGQWLFLAIGDSLSSVTSVADGVGY
ncbi:MAG TPA: hypothetical protein VFZ40_02110 [Pyrinomonadaceae bacterium]